MTDIWASWHAGAPLRHIHSRQASRLARRYYLIDEVKVEFAEFPAVHGVAASWEVRADRLWKRPGEDGDHWHKLQGMPTRFAEALSEFLEAKARQVLGREGRVRQREARALTEQQQQQEEEHRRRRDAVQQQQQQE